MRVSPLAIALCGMLTMAAGQRHRPLRLHADPAGNDGAVAAIGRTGGLDRLGQFSGLPDRRAVCRAANARGADDEAARLQERTAPWGADAAQRLAALDRENAARDQRVTDYLGARDRIRADASLGADLRNEALNQLRSRAFTPPERRRVEALEAIGQLGRR